MVTELRNGNGITGNGITRAQSICISTKSSKGWILWFCTQSYGSSLGFKFIFRKSGVNISTRVKIAFTKLLGLV